MMQIISKALTILLLIRVCYSLEENVEKLDVVTGLGTASEFQKLLYSELHTLIRATDFANPGNASSTHDEVNHLWNRIINHGWHVLLTATAMASQCNAKLRGRSSFQSVELTPIRRGPNTTLCGVQSDPSKMPPWGHGVDPTMPKTP